MIRTNYQTRVSVVFSVVVAFLAAASPAQEPNDPVLEPGRFPPPGSGTYLAGELVVVDPVNRRGALRLDGDGGERYHNGPLHYFALLPCGMVSSHGASAELRDIPLGSHVHGVFYRPPVGQEKTIPPLPAEFSKYGIAQNHAISIEDDFSFYQRHGQFWKVESLDVDRGKINLSPSGKTAPFGITEPYTFDIDDVTKIWQGRTLADLAALVPGSIVQMNLAWAPGWRDREFTVGEVWLDDAAREFATELQRRRHVRFQKQRWVPGWIDSVEHFDFGGGIVTLTLFGGLDQTLYDELKATQQDGFGVAAAEPTLRTWFHRADKKIGKVLEWNESPNPPPGSSGIQIKLKFVELLDGYRPGRAVRVKSLAWLFVTMPPEERIKSMEERERATELRLP